MASTGIGNAVKSFVQQRSRFTDFVAASQCCVVSVTELLQDAYLNVLATSCLDSASDTGPFEGRGFMEHMYRQNAATMQEGVGGKIPVLFSQHSFGRGHGPVLGYSACFTKARKAHR